MKEILGTMLIFAVLIYLGQNSYLLEWLAARYFCFIWVLILLLWVFRQEVTARWLTAGSFGGLFLGQLAEDLKWSIYCVDNMTAHSSYWGVGVWFLTVLLALGLSLLAIRLKRKREEKSTETT